MSTGSKENWSARTDEKGELARKTCQGKIARVYAAKLTKDAAWRGRDPTNMQRSNSGATNYECKCEMRESNRDPISESTSGVDRF